MGALRGEPAERLADLIRSAGSVVALTGAGISVPSGIPDFRTPGTGLWEGVNPMEVAHIDAFRSDPRRFWSFYGERFASLSGKRPNGAHAALVAMERSGMLDAVITQNVDMLHGAAGTVELVEMHGSIATCTCPGCGLRIAVEHARRLIEIEPDGVPRCEACRSPMKPDVVLFGEMLSARSIERAVQLCSSADVVLCIGSSLEVYPVAGLPQLALRSGGQVAIITQGPTPIDELASVRLSGDIEQEMLQLAAALGAGAVSPL